MEGLACQAWNLMMRGLWSASSGKIDLEKPEAEKFTDQCQCQGGVCG